MVGASLPGLGGQFYVIPSLNCVHVLIVVGPQVVTFGRGCLYKGGLCKLKLAACVKCVIRD